MPTHSEGHLVLRACPLVFCGEGGDLSVLVSTRRRSLDLTSALAQAAVHWQSFRRHRKNSSWQGTVTAQPPAFHVDVPTANQCQGTAAMNGGKEKDRQTEKGREGKKESLMCREWFMSDRKCMAFSLLIVKSD